MTTLSERMATAARVLLDEPGPKGTMDAAVKLAVSEIRGCEAAGISLVHGSGKIDTPAFTDDLALVGDRLQYELGEGPCIDSIRQERTVHSSDLHVDERWPAWGASVVEQTGVRSMLCFQLFTHADTVGALNLYSRVADGYDEADREDGLALAAHVAVAVAAAQRVDRSASSITRRLAIAHAEGVIMERHHVSAHHAFQLMLQLARERGSDVATVAEEVMATMESTSG